MQTFTGKQYLYIALANHYGLDKLTWDERLDWGRDNYQNILTNPGDFSDADEPILLHKTARELHKVLSGKPTSYLMGIDATASGLQIFAALTGCKKTAANVNLINTGKREDVYLKVAKVMCVHGAEVDRDMVKKPIMTTFYGSVRQPAVLFGEDSPELQAFYETLEEELTGAWEAMGDIQSLWQSDMAYHAWTLPDGHTAYVPVMVETDKKIEVDELDHATFTHKAYVNKPQDKGLSLAANVIHSIDGYVVREMVRRASKQGFTLLTIHDSFWASPKYINEVRDNYRQILAEIAESDLLADILSQISGYEVEIEKLSNDLADDIRNSEYALS